MATDTSQPQSTWLVVGASRGIGHEFVEQLLARGDRVIATVRKHAESFWPDRRQQCDVLICDVADEQSIKSCITTLKSIPNLRQIDYAILNAGILNYPNRATGVSFANFAQHLTTNTVGPIICAQQLLQLPLAPKTLVFISSDSGSAQEFRAFEDGFAAYAASKAALNMALRHMAAELGREGRGTVVLALHPGEVSTEMADVEVGWEVEGQMEAGEAVGKCIGTIEEKGRGRSGTFWTWEGREYPW